MDHKIDDEKGKLCAEKKNQTYSLFTVGRMLRWMETSVAAQKLGIPSSSPKTIEMITPYLYKPL